MKPPKDQPHNSGFHKPKAVKRHANSSVKLYGLFDTADKANNFTDKVVTVFAEMSREYHLFATVGPKTLTVCALMEMPVLQGAGKGKMLREISFTHYTWVEVVDINVDPLHQDTYGGFWSIVDRQHIASEVK